MNNFIKFSIIIFPYISILYYLAQHNNPNIIIKKNIETQTITSNNLYEEVLLKKDAETQTHYEEHDYINISEEKQEEEVGPIRRTLSSYFFTSST
jgi:hypothetical protein